VVGCEVLAQSVLRLWLSSAFLLLEVVLYAAGMPLL
jgi:hypothetical protein